MKTVPFRFICCCLFVAYGTLQLVTAAVATTIGVLDATLDRPQPQESTVAITFDAPIPASLRGAVTDPTTYRVETAGGAPQSETEPAIEGLKTSENHSPKPGAECQRLPSRPRPRVCSSDTTSVPSGAPSLASRRAKSLVDPTLSWAYTSLPSTELFKASLISEAVIASGVSTSR